MWEGQRLRSTADDARDSHRATGSILLPPWRSACQLGQPHWPHSRGGSHPEGRGRAEGGKEARGSHGSPVIGWRGSTDPPRKGADCWLVPTIATDVHGRDRLATFAKARP